MRNDVVYIEFVVGEDLEHTGEQDACCKISAELGAKGLEYGVDFWFHDIVRDVKEVASNASSLVISDARGLKVSELSEIRTKANESGIHIQVIKNSLAKLAFEGTDFGCSDEVLTGL